MYHNYNIFDDYRFTPKKIDNLSVLDSNKILGILKEEISYIYIFSNNEYLNLLNNEIGKQNFSYNGYFKVFLVYNKDRYLTKIGFFNEEQNKEYVMKEFEIGNEKEKKIIIEGIMGGEKLHKNTMDPRLEHMLIFLEQKENLYAICRNPTLSDTYEESFENIEKFIENRISNINSENTKRLFLISFSTKNNSP